MVPATVTFTEQWFGEASCMALADLYHKIDHLHGNVVEVGSWQGRSTIALAEASYPAWVHAVDTWLGSRNEVSALIADSRDVYAEFLANLEATDTTNVRVFRMGWRDYFGEHHDPIRFLFIDAEHSYVEVRDNIAAALPLMVAGGIICGDDAHHPPVQRAVIEAFPEAQCIATLWWAECV